MKNTSWIFLFLSVITGFMLAGCDPVDENVTGDDIRDPYIGMWQFVESGFKSTKTQNYMVSISKDSGNSSQVLLKNFGNPGIPDISVVGIVTANQIVISSQSLSNGWVVEGNGKSTNVNNSSMSWTYSITAGGDKLYYTATANRQ